MAVASLARPLFSSPTTSAPQSQRFFSFFHRYITTTSPQPCPSQARYHQQQQRRAVTAAKHRCRHQSTQNSQTPTSPQTYYTLFPLTLPLGPPPHSPFAIPLRPLHAEYLRLQALSHPDRHPTAKLRADATSAHINTAYRTLRDPLLRAQYLLSLRGIDVEDENAKTDDMELLREVMEAREEIEEAENEEEVRRLKDKNEARIEEVVRRVGGDVEGERWEGVVAGARELKYWYGIREALREWEGKG